MVKPQCPAKCRSFVVWMGSYAEYARHGEILSYERRAARYELRASSNRHLGEIGYSGAPLVKSAVIGS
jgi:hypothetical protein